MKQTGHDSLFTDSFFQVQDLGKGNKSWRL